MLPRKVVHVERNDTAPDPGCGSDSESGVNSSVHNHMAPATPLGERTVPASTSPAVLPKTSWGNKGSAVTAGTSMEPVPRRSEIVGGREVPDGTKEHPFDVGSSPANHPLPE